MLFRSETKKLRREKQVINLQKSFVLKNNCFELYLPINNQEFTLRLRNDVVVDYHNQLLTFKMKESGYGRDIRHIIIKEVQEITIFSDSSSLELFINHGEYAFTTRVYDHSSNLEIDVKRDIQCIYYELNSYKII